MTLKRLQDFNGCMLIKHIDPVVPANAALRDINISGALLRTAVEHELIPLQNAFLISEPQLIQ